MSFNHELLRRSVADKRRREGLSFQEAADAAGVGYRVIYGLEVENNRTLAANVPKLAAWLGMELDELRDGSHAGSYAKSADTPAKIEAALYADPTLSNEDAQMLSRLMRTAYRKKVAE